MGDTFHDGGDPVVRLTTTGDRFVNTRDGSGGGDRFFDIVDDAPQNIAWDILNAFDQDTAWDILNSMDQDVAWDILNALAQNIAWDILNSMDQDTAWSIFAETLYYIQQFFVKEICFNFDIKYGDTIAEQYTYLPALVMREPIQFTFSIREPITFEYGISTVLMGESDTINRRA